MSRFLFMWGMALSPGPSPKIRERGEEGRRFEGEVFDVALLFRWGMALSPGPSPKIRERGEALRRRFFIKVGSCGQRTWPRFRAEESPRQRATGNQGGRDDRNISPKTAQ